MQLRTACFLVGFLGSLIQLRDVEGSQIPEVPSRDSIPDGRGDVHSWGNPHQVLVHHLALNLSVDFDEKILGGTATLNLKRAPDAPPSADLWLDSRGLLIIKVQGRTAAGKLEALEWWTGIPRVPEAEARRFPSGTRSDGTSIHGEALVIELQGAEQVVITYTTSKNATALQWLQPSQTTGGESPFLFTQSQAIHARTWIPLQDSPGVRLTYEATISVPDGLKAVMSAEGNFGTTDQPEDGPPTFRMLEPIPSYLIALAVGDLEFKAIGPRTGIYAEPALIDPAAFEFADTETMIEATEERYGPYRWGRYDLLVLPPSFPFGGMENPRLTFATPTILAGDRSLVSLIAHELAHSWSGNLVSNATWRDFWLNEGFTTYLERRIIEDLYGADRAAMEEVLAAAGLTDALKSIPPADQRLRIDLWGRDPDDNVTAVPYDKGALFLRDLEQRFGRIHFDRFLRAYFDKFAFQSITTDQFLSELDRFVRANQGQIPGIDDLENYLQNWIAEPGLPEIQEPDSPRLDAIDRAAGDWLDGRMKASDLGSQAWSTQEWLRFLDAIPEDLPVPRMFTLDQELMLTGVSNSEIAARWLELAIQTGYGEADARLDRFLTTVGRRKFLMPLYNAMVKANELDRARTIYAKARPLYHPIAVESIDRLLGSPLDQPHDRN